MKATILFWSRLPEIEGGGVPLSAYEVAKSLNVGLGQLFGVFEAWASKGMPQEYFHPFEKIAPWGVKVYYYRPKIGPPAPMGWVFQARKWGKGIRTGGYETKFPFTVEIAVELGLREGKSGD